ncbi:MAG: hypothetical protein R2809_03400 [Flavobacteriales bacterium]
MNLLGSSVGTFMYSSELGQILTEEELKLSTVLYAYGIGTLEFTAPSDLVNFTQARAMMKLGTKLGISSDLMKNEGIPLFYKDFPESKYDKLKEYYSSWLEYIPKRKPDTYFINELT